MNTTPSAILLCAGPGERSESTSSCPAGGADLSLTEGCTPSSRLLRFIGSDRSSSGLRHDADSYINHHAAEALVPVAAAAATCMRCGWHATEKATDKHEGTYTLYISCLARGARNNATIAARYFGILSPFFFWLKPEDDRRVRRVDPVESPPHTPLNGARGAMHAISQLPRARAENPLGARIPECDFSSRSLAMIAPHRRQSGRQRHARSRFL